MKIKIGTRGSKLALWQANFVKSRLEAEGCVVELEIIKTKGDQIQHLSFDKIEGKGFFTKELEEALLAKDVDLAVHSLKDLPTDQPDGLCLAALSYREDAADCLLCRQDFYDEQRPFKLKEAALVGTSSARRKLQLYNERPDLDIRDIRGNVPTRIAKLSDGKFDAIVLAKAGLNRLNIAVPDDILMIPLNPREFIPAPGQGVLALQVRVKDEKLREFLVGFHEPEVARCTNVERSLLNGLGGGCQTPLGAYCFKDQLDNYQFKVAYGIDWKEEARYYSITQSTFVGLAEAMLVKIKENN